MDRKRIAIACQGGGSQCAFVAGAFKALLSQRAQQDFEIVGLSGTSGGALTAALAWMGLLKHRKGDSTPIERAVLACWEDLSTRTLQETALDQTCIQLLRLAESGVVPTFASSPSNPLFQLWSQAAALMVGRSEFTDLRALIVKHMDFDALPSLLGPDSPVLLVGACDVLEGSFKVFSSAHHEIQVESLLASAAIPSLFPAVWAGGHAYWDGIFSSNPPVIGFMQEKLVGKHPRPEEIWIIQVNPPRYGFVPERPSDIFDRRNHLAGNLSLQHELQVIAMVNLLLEERALTDRFRARFGIDSHEAITVRFIRMSEALQQGLDYPSKLSRQRPHIDALIADGEAQARAFLAELLPEQRVPELRLGGAHVRGTS